MTKVPQELSIVGKFLYAVVASVSSEPHIALPVYDDGMLRARARPCDSLCRPAGHVVRTAPGFQQIPGRIKFQNRWRRDAAIGTRRRAGCPDLVWIGVFRTAHHPDVIVLVRNHDRNALEDPLVRQ